jgi:sigma-B regulation protein RsbU (phosphoserine phosphatase)
MLLPRRAPSLASLDYAGPAFLGPGRLGLVLADISGKGMSAALLMANLQASLQSHYAQTPDDLPRVLRAVNESFFESSATSRYATLFFGVYDEQRAALRYANCGHPPVLLASDGSIVRPHAGWP